MKRSVLSLVSYCCYAAIMVVSGLVLVFYVAFGDIKAPTTLLTPLVYQGTYYRCISENNIDKNSYIELSWGKWTDDDGLHGSYKITGSDIAFYLDGNKKTPFVSGKIGSKKIELGSGLSTVTYIKQ